MLTEPTADERLKDPEFLRGLNLRARRRLHPDNDVAPIVYTDGNGMRIEPVHVGEDTIWFRPPTLLNGKTLYDLQGRYRDLSPDQVALILGVDFHPDMDINETAVLLKAALMRGLNKQANAYVVYPLGGEQVAEGIMHNISYFQIPEQRHGDLSFENGRPLAFGRLTRKLSRRLTRKLTQTPAKG